MCLQTVEQLLTLISNLDSQEPNNPELLYRMSLAFTRGVRSLLILILIHIVVVKHLTFVSKVKKNMQNCMTTFF